MTQYDQQIAAGPVPAAFVSDAARADPPLFTAELWPHRSMGARGFRRVMGLLAAGLALPFLALWATPAALFVGGFALAALGLVWAMFRLNYAAARIHEKIRIWPDLIDVERTEPNGRRRRWRANPYWVRLHVADTARTPSYLTLSGGGRVIELGAFLTEAERIELSQALQGALRRAAGAGRG